MTAGSALLLLDRLALPIEVLDAVGLSLFAITGATKALDAGSWRA